MTLFETLGGEPVLRRIVNRFVDRIFDDVMIGYLFRAADRERVKAKEYELAAAQLGADVVYTGRPLAEAHRPHRIKGGEFMRRLQILKDVLAEEQVPEAVVAHWLRHTESLRAAVTVSGPDECDPASIGAPREEGR